MGNIYTTTDAARRLGVSQARVRQLIEDGRLKAEKQGRDLLIPQDSLKEFEKNGRKKPGRPAKKHLRKRKSFVS
jgi:excisionase family DNA binding protein